MSMTAIRGDSLRGRIFPFNYDHLKTMMKIAFHEIKPWKLNLEENSEILALEPSLSAYMNEFPEHVRRSYGIP